MKLTKDTILKESKFLTKLQEESDQKNTKAALHGAKKTQLNLLIAIVRNGLERRITLPLNIRRRMKTFEVSYVIFKNVRNC